MRPMQASSLEPCDVIYAHGNPQIITSVREWRGVVTATFVGAPPASWGEHEDVLTSKAVQSNLSRGKGLSQ